MSAEAIEEIYTSAKEKETVLRNVISIISNLHLDAPVLTILQKRAEDEQRRRARAVDRKVQQLQK